MGTVFLLRLLTLAVATTALTVATATTVVPNRWLVTYWPNVGNETSVDRYYRNLVTHLAPHLAAPAGAARTFRHLYAGRGALYATACTLHFAGIVGVTALSASAVQYVQSLMPPTVRSIEPVRVLSVGAAPAAAAGGGLFETGSAEEQTETSAPWALDRIDQRQRTPLDGQYVYDARAGVGVDVYVVDTGIASTHPDLVGRVDTTASFTAVADQYGAADCHGHGTFVASLVAGQRYGVAKRATLHSVRVLDCNGAGTTETVLAGLDWVAQHRVAVGAVSMAAAAAVPAVSVVSMSLGGDRSPALDAAVGVLASAYNVLPVVAAGNDADDACQYSPAAAPAALAVAASTPLDQRADFSNFGPCVALFAPGTNVAGAALVGGGGTTMTGTSMSTPLVSGAAALLAVVLGGPHGLSQQALRAALLTSATIDAMTALPSAQTPNVLLYTRGVVAPLPPPTTTPKQTPSPPSPFSSPSPSPLSSTTPLPSPALPVSTPKTSPPPTTTTPKPPVHHPVPTSAATAVAAAASVGALLFFEF